MTTCQRGLPGPALLLPPASWDFCCLVSSGYFQTLPGTPCVCAGGGSGDVRPQGPSTEPPLNPAAGPLPVGRSGASAPPGPGPRPPPRMRPAPQRSARPPAGAQAAARAGRMLNVPPQAFPAPGSQQRVAAGGRAKVPLKPGRSLMDWIRLTKSGKDLTGFKGRLIEVTEDELAKHNTKEDCWICIRGFVYNVTPYMEYHPGGEDELMKAAGTDGTDLFDQGVPMEVVI